MNRRRGHHRRLLATAVAIGASLIAAGLVSSAQAAQRSPNRAAALSRKPVLARTDWARYVEAPPTRTEKPVHVVSVTGQVTNPSGLLQGGIGTTTLTYPVGGAAPVLVLDYGRDVGGYVRFDVASVSQPTALQATYSEVLANLGMKLDIPPGLPERVVPVDTFPVLGPGTVSSQDVQGGERYESVTLTAPGTVTLRSAQIEYTPFLGTPHTYAGWFESSSDLLNRIWYAGTYTTNLVQLLAGSVAWAGAPHGPAVVMDGAKRDRTIWTGDLNVVDRTLWDAFGPTGGQYAKGSLTELGDHPGSAAGFFAPSQGVATSPGPMPGACYLFVGGPDADYCPFYAASYSIDFVLDVYDYYLYSGDAAYARAAWPLVKRELAWEQAQVDSSHLFTTDYNDGADWTANQNHHVGDYAATSILHYQSLIDGAALADAVGDTGSGSSYRTQAASVREAINRLLWDQQLGAYDAATSERGFLVQDANVWAVLAGLPSHAQAERILTNLARGLAFKYGMLNVAASAPSDYAQVVSPYIGSSTLWADYQSGRPDLARSLLDTEWGWMVTHDPTGTIWEKIGLNGGLAPFDSAAHGWGTGATSALSQFVLGIQPISPGFHTWRVQPQPSGLTWAQGRVPTAAGALASRWTAGPHNASFRITVSAPPRTTGTVAVPLLGRRRVIAEDGRVVWDRSRAARRTRAVTDGTYVYFTGVTGTHTWAWSSGAGSARR